MENIRRIFRLLNPRQRRLFLLLLFFSIVLGLLQIGTVGSIVPFIGIVTNPNLIESNELLSNLYSWGGFQTTNQFLVFLGGLVLFSLVLTNGMTILYTWLSQRYVWNVNATLSHALLKKYLSRPYTWYLSRNSAKLGTKIISETMQFTQGALFPLVDTISKSITILFLTFLIILVDYKVALFSLLILGGSYTFIYLYFRKKLTRIGENRSTGNQHRLKSVQEAFGAIKETKVLQREDFFIQDFQHWNDLFCRSSSTSVVIQQVPRYFLEILAFGGMISLVIYLLNTRKDLDMILPLLSMYALAGFRLMPALQSCFQTAASLRFSQPVVDNLYLDYFQSDSESFNSVEMNEIKPAYFPSRLPFQQKIELQNVSYSYPGSSVQALQPTNLTIPKGHSIALCGVTGSGKSTLSDIILGLLPPQTGTITVDGQRIDSQNLPNWMRNIGYVPQSIHLGDTTVARNIALGISDHEIDHEAVISAAKLANIHDFILSELPNGYDTIVGERGVRLSGGQRQRLGIARALYHKPELLIFDEATSALDGITEDKVVEAVQRMSGVVTIIMIAHRLTTVRACEQIYLMDKGRIISQGTYPELAHNNDLFRKMAKMDASALHAEKDQLPTA